MYFGECAEFDINKQLEIQSYIENYFLETILNENVEGTIENEISKLKKKNIEEVTKEDLEKIIRKIKNIDDKESRNKTIIGCIVSLITWISGYSILKISVTSSAICLIISLLIDLWVAFSGSSDGYGSERIMRILMKYEAKLNTKKQKTSDEDEIKDIDEVIDYVEKLKKALYRSINNNFKKSKSVDEAYIDEAYKGNFVKTDVYRQILNEVEDLVEAFKARIDKSYEIAEKQLKELEKAKDAKSLNNAIVRIRDIGINGGKEIEEISKDICGALTWKMFIKDTNKFVNKYSITSFDNKRALATKLNNVSKQLKDQADKYFDKNSNFVSRLTKSHDKSCKINIELADRGYKVIISWLNYSIQEANATFEDINYVINILGIHKSTNNLLFKLLNGKELLKRSDDDYKDI